MAASLLSGLDYNTIEDHYTERVFAHQNACRLFNARKSREYADLALGISAGSGNYSASEHGLGPRILSRSTPGQVLDLATTLVAANDPMDIPRLVQDADIWCLKISVGSEMSAMLDPNRFWVTNVRTVWAHLLVKHNDDLRRANAELKAYRDDEYDSEMLYAVWNDIHKKLDVALTRLAEASTPHAEKQEVRVGSLTYLWADAIASDLYRLHKDL